MYNNHNLRTDLQEWKSRLSRSTHSQFGNQLKFILTSINKNKQLSGLLNEACISHPYNDAVLNKLIEREDYYRMQMEFNSDVHQAAFCYQYLTYYIKTYTDGKYNINHYSSFQRGDAHETIQNIIDEYITPIFNYFHDRLDKSNSTIYLLEKYKRRTEWFTKETLLNQYKDATKNYEGVFEDDLRLFLFDQGIDFPFSTPKSSTGKRADIVGAIDTDDPIIIEVKIIDKVKKYGKNRIKDGYKQILKYTSDYNKDVGYLVIFNIDNAELNFKLSDSSKVFPPMMVINNKTLFFVTINLYSDEKASEPGKVSVIDISEEDLIN